MQRRYLYSPPYFFYGPAVSPHTFFILESPLALTFSMISHSLPKSKKQFFQVAQSESDLDIV